MKRVYRFRGIPRRLSLPIEVVILPTPRKFSSTAGPDSATVWSFENPATNAESKQTRVSVAEE